MGKRDGHGTRTSLDLANRRISIVYGSIARRSCLIETREGPPIRHFPTVVVTRSVTVCPFGVCWTLTVVFVLDGGGKWI